MSEVDLGISNRGQRVSSISTRGFGRLWSCRVNQLARITVVHSFSDVNFENL